MSNLRRAEQAAFNEDFNRIFAAEHRADARDAAIEDEMKTLLEIGGECYPFSPANMFEALTQISDGKQAMIQSFFATANDAKGFNDLANHGFYTATRFAVNEYWQDAAKTIAVRNVDSRLS
jgi:hypothetical protein